MGAFSKYADMTGLDPGIHVLMHSGQEGVDDGTSPAMTNYFFATFLAATFFTAGFLPSFSSA
jgi:hypothetical protein